MARTGRPTKYTPKIGADICTWISQGKTLVDWCKANSLDRSTVHRWLLAREDFRSIYAEAKLIQADLFFEDTLAIASNYGDVARDRLRVDTLKWVLARMNSKKYGDRSALDVGGQPDNPLTIADLAKKAREDES